MNCAYVMAIGNTVTEIAESVRNVRSHIVAELFKPFRLPPITQKSYRSGWRVEMNRSIDINAIFAERVIRSSRSCKTCIHWNAETHGCKRNPSVEAWYENDYCSYWEMDEVEE